MTQRHSINVHWPAPIEWHPIDTFHTLKFGEDIASGVCVFFKTLPDMRKWLTDALAQLPWAPPDPSSMVIPHHAWRPTTVRLHDLFPEDHILHPVNPEGTTDDRTNSSVD